jgi:3-hydroxybutyryl-CoA dehydratase
MTRPAYRPRGRYFEDFSVGDTLATAGRTITEADIVSYAGLSGDFNQIHIDAEYAAAEFYGQRVAHGLLVLSVAVGLAVQSGFVEGTVLNFRELDWKFSLPVMIGDTIHVEAEITKTKALPRLGGGSITMKVAVYNHDDQVVNRGNWIMLVKSQESEGE